MLTYLHTIKGRNIMAMIAARIDIQENLEFELLAKMQHKTKSQLLKELIKKYLQNKKINTYLQAARNIADHEKSHPEKYSDIYALRHDWN